MDVWKTPVQVRERPLGAAQPGWQTTTYKTLAQALQHLLDAPICEQSLELEVRIKGGQRLLRYVSARNLLEQPIGLFVMHPSYRAELWNWLRDQPHPALNWTDLQLFTP